MSLLDLIDEEGDKLARAEREAREALEKLYEANRKLSEEVKERRLAESRLRILCDTMTRTDITFPERVIIMLQSACQNFNLEAGIVSNIEGDCYKIVYSWSDRPMESILPGTVYDLNNTYCKELSVQERNSIGISHIGESEWKNSPVYVRSHIEAYFGACVRIQQKFWGALCFFDIRIHEKPFTQPDHDFLRLMAQWIGAELSFQQERLES